MEVEPVEIYGTLPVLGERDTLVEELSPVSRDSISLSGFQTLLYEESGWGILDETKSESITLGDVSNIGGLVLDIDNILLLLDSEAMIYSENTLESSPLNDVIPIPAEEVFGNINDMC